MTVHVSSASEWRQIVSSNTIVVTDFYADWCGPCKMIAPTFESLSTKYSKPNRIAFAKVDVDNQREVAQQYGVRAMPTFVILRNGSVIDTIQGANPPALTAAVDKAVKLAAAAAPGAAFSTPGRTLGGTSSSGSTGSSATAGHSAGGSTTATAARARPGGAPILGRANAWDLNSLINTLIMFFGLYFTSLFSLDPYMAAQNSKYNIRNPTVPINISGAFSGSRSGTSGGQQRSSTQAKSAFRTLADLGSE